MATKVVYWNPVTLKTYGDTPPPGDYKEVTSFDLLTPEALDEFMRNRQKELEEVVITPKKDFSFSDFIVNGYNNFEDTFGFSGKEAASYLPYIGDLIDIYDVGDEINNKNYGTASIIAGSLLLPNFIEKPAKSLYRIAKNIFGNKHINKEATEKVLKAVKNYSDASPYKNRIYNTTELKRQLKKEGVDVNKFSNEELQKLQWAREHLLRENASKAEGRVALAYPLADKDEYAISLLDGNNLLGRLDLENVTRDKGLDIRFIRNYSGEHKVGEDLYNSGILFSNSRGYKGIITGKTLWSPEKTTSTMTHFPSKIQLNNKGEYMWKNNTKTTFNNPVYRLEVPGDRPTVSTRDLSKFSSEILDKDGRFIINWASPRLDYKFGGKLNKWKN